MAFAAAEFKMGRKMPDGRPYREHLQAAARHSVQARAELEGIASLSELAAPIWARFLDISARRTSSGFGPNPIGWQDLDAYQRLIRVNLDRFEIDCLFDLDRLFLMELAEEQKSAQKGKR